MTALWSFLAITGAALFGYAASLAVAESLDSLRPRARRDGPTYCRNCLRRHDPHTEDARRAR